MDYHAHKKNADLNFIHWHLIGLWKVSVEYRNGCRSECDWLNCSMALNMLLCHM